jgi:DNA processing protein
MACPDCRHRAALIAALAPAIERLAPLTRQSLLGLLALDDERLCHAVGVEDHRARSRRVDTTLSAGASDTAAARGAPGAICRHDPGYPEALAELDCAPAVLHATCTTERLLALLAAPTVALVGDRFHTGYAHEATFAIARDLASAGVTVVSGLHQGLDGIAQHGALHAGGRTVAVTGCAPEIPYPRQLDHLHRRIVTCGAAVSELPPGFHPPRRWCFIASQRIIAALAHIVVIVEAVQRSSALLTAQIASDLGRDIAVVPGRVSDPGAQGTFALLRDGAHPVACAQDVLDLIYGESSSQVAA